MGIAELRERLHEYINEADEQHLSAIYTLVGNGESVDRDTIYDDKTMKMLYERREKHRNGSSRSFTLEESMDLIKRHKKE